MFRKFIFVAVLLLATISVVVADDKPKANFIEDTIRKIKELFSGAPKPVAEKAAPAVEKIAEPVQEVKKEEVKQEEVKEVPVPETVEEASEGAEEAAPEEEEVHEPEETATESTEESAEEPQEAEEQNEKEEL